MIASEQNTKISTRNLQPILQATGLRIPAIGMSPAFRCELHLNPGQLTMIRCDDRARAGALVDGLLGLTQQTGEVKYRETSWSDMLAVCRVVGTGWRLAL